MSWTAKFVCNFSAATAKVIEAFSQIDVLINNAGVLRDGMLVKVKEGQVSVMSDEQFDTVIDVNLRGVFLCTRAVAPHMIARKSGVIVSASSVVGLYGNFGQTNYVAAAYVFLASDQGSFISGHCLSVDGGAGPGT